MGQVSQIVYFNFKQQITWFPFQSNPHLSQMEFSILICHATMLQKNSSQRTYDYIWPHQPVQQ